MRRAFFLLLLSRPLFAQPIYESTVAAPRDHETSPERAGSAVDAQTMALRQPRSAPDALRYEPGVFVQQTAHGQGSAFIRGLTGQQTVLLFDGIRLSNGTYRQGPNQYFFTLDARTIQSIEIQRGGGSTRFGSDALGGVIYTHPLQPRFSDDRTRVHGMGAFRTTTADGEAGGRAAVEVQSKKVALLAGVGGRHVGLLKAGGIVTNPLDGKPALVPRFGEDGKTQLGTGFDEITADVRLLARPRARHVLTLAAYTYHQLDAPRTDLCAPPLARFDECFKYEEQFRTLVYGAWQLEPGAGAVSTARVTLSWQRQHEKRRNDRPASFVVTRGTDDVDTVGLTANALTPWWRPRDWLGLRLHYGLDNYVDHVASRAEIAFSDIDVRRALSRGQYLDGSTYLYGGTFLDGEAALGRRFIVRLGGRASWIWARAPGDPASGSKAIDASWFPVVGHGGVEWRAFHQTHGQFSVLVNVDHSFRAPNLDDLTSRQQTGPGFQFENPSLRPERATTFEGGLRLRTKRVIADLWGFEMLLDDLVVKQPRAQADCPPESPQCLSSANRFALVNSAGRSEMRGVEAAVLVHIAHGVTVRGTLAYTWGEGPNPSQPPADPSVPYQARVPLSRVPPLNGTLEAGWQHRSGFFAGAAVRMAAAQDRLAVADRSDARIPLGGTPGFSVVDLRVAWRTPRFLVAAILENLFDVAYRYHGSSVNGPGRGLILALEAAPF